MAHVPQSEKFQPHSAEIDVTATRSVFLNSEEASNSQPETWGQQFLVVGIDRTPLASFI